MARSISKLVIATHNKGKLREFSELLTAHIPDIVSAGDLNLPEPEETGTTFAENAILKAEAAAKATGCAALADDSGLCVTALNNEPGIYSARWALSPEALAKGDGSPTYAKAPVGQTKNFGLAMQLIHDKMGDTQNRAAHFISVLAVVWPNGHRELFEGRIDGTLCWPPRGDQGHGYDPFFVPNGHSHTFAEMDGTAKNAISHRGIAVRKLLAWFARP